MRRIIKYSISKEAFKDMCKARRFNPCLEITFRDKTGRHTHKLSAGYGDDIHVYREDKETFVLSQNTGLGYIGIEVFSGCEKIGDIFLEHHQVIEALGNDNLAQFTIIRRLRNHFYS